MLVFRATEEEPSDTPSNRRTSMGVGDFMIFIDHLVTLTPILASRCFLEAKDKHLQSNRAGGLGLPH